MSVLSPEWSERVAALWRAFDSFEPDDFVVRIDALAAEMPSGDPRALYERGSAQDSTGRSDLAVPLYNAALVAGLSGSLRRQATIQLASSLRNLGRAGESVALLTAELDAASDELDGAVRAFLALALVDVGRERDAVATSLLALVPYLPRYNRSLANYARELSAAAR
jgi:tetratricopeptide repeat protein